MLANNIYPMVEESLLAAAGLVRYHHGREILHGIDMTLRRGEILGLLGPNGAGKSTTMNILAGILAPHRGAVAICGHALDADPIAGRKLIGYLPEHPPVYPDATVDEYLGYCARLRSLGKASSQAIATVKSDCALNDVGARLVGNLSKGYQQRLGIAQAMLHRPPVLILDEPTSGLDPNQIRAIRTTLQHFARKNAIVLSTHILAEVEALCSRALVLNHGRIVFDAALSDNSAGLCVGLRDIAAEPHWGNLDGVIQGSNLGPGQWWLEIEDYDRAADAVCQQALAAGWGLRELRRDSSQLEQVFVNLSTNPQAPPP